MQELWRHTAVHKIFLRHTHIVPKLCVLLCVRLRRAGVAATRLRRLTDWPAGCTTTGTECHSVHLQQNKNMWEHRRGWGGNRENIWPLYTNCIKVHFQVNGTVPCVLHVPQNIWCTVYSTLIYISNIKILNILCWYFFIFTSIKVFQEFFFLLSSVSSGTKFISVMWQSHTK